MNCSRRDVRLSQSGPSRQLGSALLASQPVAFAATTHPGSRVPQRLQERLRGVARPLEHQAPAGKEDHGVKGAHDGPAGGGVEADDAACGVHG